MAKRQTSTPSANKASQAISNSSDAQAPGSDISTTPSIVVRAAAHIKLRDAADLAEMVSTPSPGDTPYIFLLGAGASVSSGIDTAAKMIERWQRQVFEKLSDKSQTANFDSWRTSALLVAGNRENADSTYRNWRWNEYGNTNESDYSLLFRRAFPAQQQRQNYIETLIDGKDPGPGYLFLAGLIFAERLNCVLTTNFDNLVHDALFRYYNVRPIVCAFDSTVGGFRVRTKRPKIIKLHGDFLYDNIRNMKDELLLLDRNIEEKMREVCKGAGLIVAGYSGGDDSIMHPIRDMLRNPDHLQMGLHWCLLRRDCERGNPIDEFENVPRHILDLAEDFPGKVSLYKIESFDLLMEVLFCRCGCKWPDSFREPEKFSQLQLFARSVTGASSNRSSRFLTKQVEAFVTSAKSSLSSLWADLVLADLLHSQARDERDAGNMTTATNLAQRSREIVSRHDYRAEDLPLEARIRILRRLSGLAIFDAKCLSIDEREAAIRWVRESIEMVTMGLEISRQHNYVGFNVTYFRSLPFNGCCAYGRLDSWGVKLTDEELTRVIEYVGLIRQFDSEGEHIDKLCNMADGEDFQSTLLPKYRSAIEKHHGELPIRKKALPTLKPKG